MKHTTERRYIESELRADDEADSLPVLEGYAAVFDSVVSIGGYFREVIRPGAFSRAIKEKQDVRALIDHNHSLIIGRTAAGTLKLTEDERGLKVEIHPPNTTLARDLVENIKLGNISQMSFAFRVSRARWTEEENQPDLREIEDVDLIDVSPVTYPAYEDTEIFARSAEDIYKTYQREKEEKVIVPQYNLMRMKLDILSR